MKRKTYESFHANILIRKDQFETVREIADRKSISISALIRMLLDDYLKGDLEHETAKKAGLIRKQQAECKYFCFQLQHTFWESENQSENIAWVSHDTL